MFKMKIKMDTSGVDRMLKRMEDNVKRVSGSHQVPLSEMMTPEFMRKHSSFGSTDEFFAAVGIEDTVFVDMPAEQQDEFTRQHTTFSTWQELINDAGARYIEKQILS